MNKEIQNTKENSSKTGLIFNVYRPGGNDTCIVEGIPKVPGVRRWIDEQVRNNYANVEQVGFVQVNQGLLELMMAGGEFCGNATRSTVWKYLQGEPGEVRIKVSGVNRLLKAGIDTNGEVFSEMPLQENAQKVTKDPDNPQAYFVEMEGITHYVSFNWQDIENKSPEEIKATGDTVLESKGLKTDSIPASGVIYVKQEDGKFVIAPVVYVRAINSLYYESACGSGTTALGAVLAIRKGETITDIAITQPSGMEIKVTIDYDGKKFNYAEIKGEVQELQNGTADLQRNLLCTFETLSQKDLASALSNEGLGKLYQEAFGDPPYNERFTNEEVEGFFAEYVAFNALTVARADGKIIGFEATLPLAQDESVAALLSETAGIDPNEWWYMADLGVKKEYRKNGIGRALVEKRLAQIGEKPILLRTSIDNFPAISIYKACGFTQVPGVYQEVQQERTDGTINTDRRIFLWRK